MGIVFRVANDALLKQACADSVFTLLRHEDDVHEKDLA
jgi:hypothetical protein